MAWSCETNEYAKSLSQAITRNRLFHVSCIQMSFLTSKSILTWGWKKNCKEWKWKWQRGILMASSSFIEEPLLCYIQYLKIRFSLATLLEYYSGIWWTCFMQIFFLDECKRRHCENCVQAYWGTCRVVFCSSCAWRDKKKRGKK